jgi:hypothetical protein
MISHEPDDIDEGQPPVGISDQSPMGASLIDLVFISPELEPPDAGINDNIGAIMKIAAVRRATHLLGKI